VYVTGLRRRFQESRAQALLIPVGAAILGGFYLAFTALRAGDSMHFDVTPLSTAFALVAGVAIAAGVVVVMRLGERQIGAGSRWPPVRSCSPSSRCSRLVS
jgi:hypothetical protein